MSARVLLSYRRTDVAAQQVALLNQRLTHRFGRVAFWDSNDGIPLGSDFRDAIDQAVKQSDSVLVLIGPLWLSATGADGQRRLDDPDDLVRYEIRAALDARKRVVPVLVDGAQMPRTDQLPADIARLASLQAIEIDSRQLEEVLFRTAPSADSAMPTAAQPSSPAATQLPREWNYSESVDAAAGAPRGKVGGALTGATIGMITAAFKAVGRLVGSLAPSSRGSAGHHDSAVDDGAGHRDDRMNPRRRWLAAGTAWPASARRVGRTLSASRSTP